MHSQCCLLLILTALAITGCATVRETPLAIAPLKHTQIYLVTQKIGIISDNAANDSCKTCTLEGP